MKYKLLSIVMLMITSLSLAQQRGSFWSSPARANSTPLDSRMNLPTRTLLDLDLNAFKSSVTHAPQRGDLHANSNIIVSLPNSDGQMENFKVYENSTSRYLGSSSDTVDIFQIPGRPIKNGKNV